MTKVEAVQAREVAKKTMAENAARGYGIDTEDVKYPVDHKGMMTPAEMERRLLAAGLGRRVA